MRHTARSTTHRKSGNLADESQQCGLPPIEMNGLPPERIRFDTTSVHEA
jgi:hypothetical protein